MTFVPSAAFGWQHNCLGAGLTFVTAVEVCACGDVLLHTLVVADGGRGVKVEGDGGNSRVVIEPLVEVQRLVQRVPLHHGWGGGGADDMEEQVATFMSLKVTPSV